MQRNLQVHVLPSAFVLEYFLFRQGIEAFGLYTFLIFLVRCYVY